jgi:hypothetical protein
MYLQYNNDKKRKKLVFEGCNMETPLNKVDVEMSASGPAVYLLDRCWICRAARMTSNCRENERAPKIFSNSIRPMKY